MTLKSLPFTVCPTCRGGGCIACEDVGVFLPYGEHILTWRREISEDTFARESRARVMERNTRIVLAVFTGIGAVVYAVAIFLGASPSAPFVDDHPAYLFVWFSVLAGTYWFARTQRARESGIRIPPGAPQDTAVPYDIIAQMPPDAFIDVSSYVSLDTRAILDAAYWSARAGHDAEVMPLHLFSALFHSREALFLFGRLGLAADELSRQVTDLIATRTAARQTDQPPVVSGGVWRVMFAAYVLAAEERHPVVEVRHVLRALLDLDEAIATILFDRGVDRQTVDHVLQWLRSHEAIREVYLRLRSQARFKPRNTMNRALTARPTPVLDSVSDDLTLVARAGMFPPLVNRSTEFTDMLRVLSHGGNILLLGEPGTGKSVMLHGLAERMVSEDVPATLQDKRLVRIDAAKLFAQAAGGVAEARLAAIIEEVTRAGNVVLAMEDIANLLGAKGQGTEVDLSDIITQAADHPRFQMVATSIVADYNQSLQRFPAFLRRFERITIEEPDLETAILIAQAKASEFEYLQSVLFSYAAVQYAVEGAKRYLPNERLPASALKVLEEAAVLVRETKGQNAIVEKEDVAKVLSRMTSIPLTTATGEERERLLNLEGRIHERLVNQDEAVKAVADALRRARAELRDPNRPIVNLLFLGPTGVGKTEMAKQVARVEFGAPDAMIRIDLTEYQEVEALSRLIGTPDRSGILTDAVRNRPYAVVLLDELEKAHPDILNVFLQVMDDGRLTDARGNLVSFTNAIIIATSNAGTDLLTQELQSGRSLADARQVMARDVLPKFFRPELINRFDGVILFQPLSFDHILAIAGLLLEEVKARIAQRGITLEVTEAALREVAEKGNDPTYGARTLRRAIQEDVDAALAKYLLAGDVDRRDRIILDAGGAIRVEKAGTVT